jgi:hypothetical protein
MDWLLIALQVFAAVVVVALIGGVAAVWFLARMGESDED